MNKTDGASPQDCAIGFIVWLGTVLNPVNLIDSAHFEVGAGEAAISDPPKDGAEACNHAGKGR